LRGRTLLFYLALRHRLTNRYSYVINDNVMLLLHLPAAIFPTITLLPPSTDERKKEWILTQRQNNVTIGKIIKKLPSSQCTYQHWIFTDQNEQTIMPYIGCHLTPSLRSNQHNIDKDYSKCILSIPGRNAKVIHTVLCNNQQSTTPKRSIITPIQNYANTSHRDIIGLYNMEQPLVSIEIENIDELLIFK
jgi:hypothetical protein